MNITEFAEQIVFSNSLEEKIAAPGKLSFDRLSTAKLPASKSLRTPGRPSHLLMQPERGRTVQPPRDDQLENDKARGQLLHFLANHELLATELMALVLLKFPDAPRAFRQGILVTLQEEQLHTRMYLQRMKECGVEFGAYPVSGQFWRIVEPMDSPMDFVSRLSLTFEQANLDFSLHFSNVFDRIGDSKTASLLQKIYEDEIGHVQHGLEWFRQWKDPDKSDFDAWQSTLEFPMTPGRGRAGPRAPFNRDGRHRAGLSDEFIDAIEVFGQSKDRSASVRWFDPAAEAELAGDVSPKLDQLGRDLEFVTIAMSKADDVLLVRELPSQALRKHWIESGIELPEFCLMDELDSLQHRKLNRFEPWAWTPKNHSLADGIRESVRHSPSPWNESKAQLFRKSWGTKALTRWLSASENLPSWMGGTECIGIPVGQECSLSNALATIAARGFDVAIYKPELSASGRGMHRIDIGPTLPEKKCRSEIDAVVEPWFERVVDLSFLWHVSKNGAAKFQGWTRPLISKGGRYEGTVLGNPFADCDVEVRKFLLADRYRRIRQTASWLESKVLPDLLSIGFTGHFGIDAFVYRDNNTLPWGGSDTRDEWLGRGNLPAASLANPIQEGDEIGPVSLEAELKFRPFVELNPRMTMGHIGLALEKRIANGVTAKFRILTRSEFNKQEHLFSSPLVRSKDGRWQSGVVWLGERDAEAKLIPCVVVGDLAKRKKHEPN